MKLSAEFSRESILNQNGLNHLQIEVIPPQPESDKQSERKPVLMVFVLDRSGSMSESANKIDFTAVTRGMNPRVERISKMDHAINSTIKFMSLMTEKDLFGVVSFDSISFVDQPLTHITDKNRNDIAYNISRITPRASTNISDAIVTAKKLITKELSEKYNCKIILLSDGQANEGIRSVDGLSSLALDCMKEGITISTLGVGLDYNSSIMEAIATSGGGLFYHIEDLTKLEEIFKEELNLSGIVTAKQVKLIMDIPDLIEIGENMNNYTQEIKNNQIHIYIGDMHNSRRVLFEIRNNFVDTDINFNIRVVYKELNNAEHEIKIVKALNVVKTQEELDAAPKNEEIIKTVLSIVKNNTIANSAEAYERGDLQTVGASFSNSTSYMRGLTMSYGVSQSDANEIFEEMEEMEEAYTTQSVSKSQTKLLFAQSRKSVRE